ncbi:MAG: ATP-binding protein [Thermoleophilia bacterium]|nr:ATP-binding protein [Thermoleophilia bacterium]
MTTRLVVAFVGIATIVLGVLVVPLGINFQQGQTQELSARVERDAFVLASLTQHEVASGDAPARGQLASIAERYQRDTGGRVVIVGLQGRLLYDSEPPIEGPRSFASRPEFERALNGEVVTLERYSRTLDQELLTVAVPVAAGGEVLGAVRVSFPTDELDATVREYWLRLAVISIVMLLASAVVAIVLARWALAPLARVSSAAVALGEGELGARADPDYGPPEVRRLAHSFNTMADQLANLVESQRRFVSDASHQLRTPLTTLQLELDNLAMQATDDRRRGRLEELIDETQRLAGLIDGLLALARADAPDPPLASVSVADVAAERVAKKRKLAAKEGVELIDETGHVPVRAVVGGLEQMLDNLLDNALTVSPEGGRVTVSTHANGRLTEIVVRDEGPGLSADEQARAFGRFWRGAGSTTPGSGLGLAIVRQLAEASSGDAALRDAPGGGTEAVVRLPIAGPTED